MTHLSRSGFLYTGSLAFVAIDAKSRFEAPATVEAEAPSAVEPQLSAVKALVFDTFGTVVDWRSSMIAVFMIAGSAAAGCSRISVITLTITV